MGRGSRALAQAPAEEEPAGLVVIESTQSLSETEHGLVQAVEQAGLKIAARIDYQANAKKVGLALPPTVLLLFGNPATGSVLIDQKRTIGIDLPLKILIWETEGKIRLAYSDPAYLARRHGIAATTPALVIVSKSLQAFAAAAAGK